MSDYQSTVCRHCENPIAQLQLCDCPKAMASHIRSRTSMTYVAEAFDKAANTINSLHTEYAALQESVTAKDLLIAGLNKRLDECVGGTKRDLAKKLEQQQEKNARLTVQVQEGWKWVPVEPTADMKNAGIAYFREHKDDIFNSATHYQEMLAAAPALPQQVKSEDDQYCQCTYPLDFIRSCGKCGKRFAPPDAAISAQD